MNLDNSQVCVQGVPPAETPKIPAEPGAATANKRKRDDADDKEESD